MNMNQQQQGHRDASPLVSGQRAISGILLSEPASIEIRKLVQEQGRDPAEYGLRLSLVPGGCSGFLHVLTVDKPRNNDSIFDAYGIRAIVDNLSLTWLDGSTIDYAGSGSSSGFRIHGPEFFPKGPCQCGSNWGG